LHGVYLSAERWLSGRFGRAALWQHWAARWALGLLTYALINITWVFFRAQDFATAWRMLQAMLGLSLAGQQVLPTIDLIQVTGITVLMLAAHGFMRDRELHAVVMALPRWLLGVVWGAMLWLILITQGESHAFIYFQF
jgi:alginate O-acetyltransferase complex protein AlgI